MNFEELKEKMFADAKKRKEAYDKGMAAKVAMLPIPYYKDGRKAANFEYCLAYLEQAYRTARNAADNYEYTTEALEEIDAAHLGDALAALIVSAVTMQDFIGFGLRSRAALVYAENAMHRGKLVDINNLTDAECKRLLQAIFEPEKED